MKQAINNIIPRLIKFSKQMDKVETFVDKSWIYIDQSGYNHEYYFMRDHRLIMSVNGDANTGKWELLPNGKLLIDRVSDQIVLKNQFIDEALMVLQKSASDEDPFILVDEQKIPDLDVLRYLQEFEEKKIPNEFPFEPETVEILRSGRVRFKDIEIGFKVKHHEGLIVSGTFDLGLDNVRRNMVVENGIITDLYYIDTYIDEKGQELEIKQKLPYFTSGSMIINLSNINLEFDKKTFIKQKKYHSVELKVKIERSGEVHIVPDFDLGLFTLFFLFVIFVFILVIMSGK
jgi:hypothetical protein